MRDPMRIEPTLALLRAAWYMHPDWRLGQLIENVLAESTNPTYYVEDSELAQRLRELINRPVD